MKHLRLGPGDKASERMTLAITPLKAELFKRLCKMCKNTASGVLNHYINLFISDELFELNQAKKLETLNLSGELKEYALKIVGDETCRYCKKKTRYQVSLDEKLVEDVKTIQEYLSGAYNLSGLLNTLLESWMAQNSHVMKGSKCDACGKPIPGKLYR